MSYTPNIPTGKVDTNNSTTTPLNAGATFTGTATDALLYPSVVVACRTDQDGLLYLDFSTDGTNWDSALSWQVTANTNEVHKVTVTRKYMRARLVNTSASNQTMLRLQVILGSQQMLTSPLNSLMQGDADAIAVRPLDFNLMTAEGLYQNRGNTIKDGLITTIPNGAGTTDLWTSGGAYTGFPTTAEAGQVVVAGADTGTVYYTYLESETSLDYVMGSVAITGPGTYNLGHNIWRCNFAWFVGSNPTAFNVSLITIRHAVTTANIFCRIEAGVSQSYCAAYTVPFGSSIYLDRINGSVRGSSSGSLDGYFWFRDFGGSPRLRFPFELQFGTLFFDDVDYLVRIPQRTDIMPRITNSSANGLSAKMSYRFIKVKS